MVLDGRDWGIIRCDIRREGGEFLVIFEGREGSPLYMRREGGEFLVMCGGGSLAMFEGREENS